ncbi:hypothetical protein [Pseudalkalibacillus sp. JSM 102089]|uniref:hypothetical protein n=1 Tax=Pseudalkalibacillus sp. JSM 102089 TaxID=3229856 RepID=UPI0035266445
MNLTVLGINEICLTAPSIFATHSHNLYALDERKKIANTYDLIYCSIVQPNIHKGLGLISVQ